MIHRVTQTPDETIALGSQLGKELKKGAFIALIGDLGSGKTIFTKGIAKGLGVKDYRYVNSPSFVIIKEYKGKMPLYHFDIYRLNSSKDLDSVGYEEYFYGQGVTVVEWADKIKDILPEKRIDVTFTILDDNRREIKLVSHHAPTKKIIELIQHKG